VKKSNKKIIFKVQSSKFKVLPNQGVTLLTSANVLLSDTSHYIIILKDFKIIINYVILTKHT
jgi:hypothetical protein